MLVSRGRCTGCAGYYDKARGSATQRGYDSHWFRVFRPRFFGLLIAHDIVPVCGAALPDGPRMGDSLCKAAGRLTDSHLHVDHDPPLTQAERADRSIVEDVTRVGLLCRACHARKTSREQRRR